MPSEDMKWVRAAKEFDDEWPELTMPDPYWDGGCFDKYSPDDEPFVNNPEHDWEGQIGFEEWFGDSE